MIKKYIIYSIVIILTFSQCYILISYKKNHNVTEINNDKLDSISDNKKAKNIRDIKKDFNKFKTLTILTYNKLEDGSWELKCLLKGNKEDILEDIEKFDNYDMTDYNLSYENNSILIETNIIYKD